MNQPLANKRALVTGGSRGIGAAIVRRLARDGAHVALTYVSKPERADETVEAAVRQTGANSWCGLDLIREWFGCMGISLVQ